MIVYTYEKKQIVIAVKNARSDMAREERDRERRASVPVTSFENVLIAIHTFSKVFSAVPENDTQHKREPDVRQMFGA